ncbi:12584_t:CDS:2, partial [Cetraspora pellucida]
MRNSLNFSLLRGSYTWKIFGIGGAFDGALGGALDGALGGAFGNALGGMPASSIFSSNAFSSAVSD